MYHLDQKPIISEVLQMEWCVPFDFPTRISGFSTPILLLYHLKVIILENAEKSAFHSFDLLHYFDA